MWFLPILLNKLLNGGSTDHEEADSVNLVETYNYKSSLRNKNDKKKVLLQSHFIDVPHIKQKRNWDCGLACVLMVLRTLNIKHFDFEDLEAFCPTISIWTVDLAYLLHKLSIRFSYITVTLGANPNFSLETFYEKQLTDDIIRVNMLFQRSQEAGINIECRSIKGDEIALLILSGKHIVIALVDLYILSQPWTKKVDKSDLDSSSSSYTGHYIIICGYDARTDEFEIRDPASSRYRETISSRCLEKARISFGTDEDILLIHLENTDT
uniref:guanylyl cyclase 1-like n=1 Tax=Erigeron canadensis TaxID=72917 RepID=UPI001CB9966D|nr:guanylyl cyclase 1-like [Erigeron canadensis]XP_043616881.1 guanylyl cyclase 1-like [Erigeron canadensis]